MANARRTQIRKKLNNKRVQMPENAPCCESQKSILLKIKNGDYKLVKRDMTSSIWKIFREIHRSNGSKLLGRYYCVGCKQILKSMGCTNSNLRSHKCHVNNMKQGELNLLNSSTKSHVATTAKNVKLENEMSETECETNNEDDKYKNRKKFNSNQTEVVAKRNSRYVSQRFKWDDDATKMFLQLWAAHIEDFRGSRTNADVHKEMATEMKKFGLTHVEIKAKIDNMSKRYKKESELASSTGVPSKWEHFYKLRSLLTGTSSSLANNIEEMMMKHSDSEDDETSNSFETEDENLLLEETFDDGMLPDEQETSVEVEELQPETEFKEQLDMTEPFKPYSEESRAERLLQIEEEKLEIEREKLNIMKTFKRDITSIHKDLIEMLRRKNNKL